MTRTGIISIKTLPEGADIHLNGKLIRQETPTSLSGLLPGEYEIELNLEGYWPFVKKAVVEADRVTRLEDILFFPKAPKIKSILKPEKFDAFFLSPSGKRILFISDEEGEDNFYILHIGDKTLRALHALPKGQKISAENIKATWSDDEDVALIQIEGSNYLLFLKQPKKSYFLEDVIGFKPEMVKLNKYRNFELFYLKDGELTQFDIKRKRNKATVLKDIVDFEPADFGLLWMKKDSPEVYRSSREGRSIRRFGNLRNFQGLTPIAWKSTSKFLSPFEKSKWAGLDREGNFYVLKPQFYHPAVKGFRYSPSGKQILFWNDYELWLLDEQPDEGRESGSPRYSRNLIFESEIPIQNAFWSPEENYVFFLTHRKVYALELDTKGGINLYPFYVSKDHFVWPHGWAIDEDEGLFYWISEKPHDYRQLRVLRLSVGFLEPFVSKVVGQMETFRNKISPSGLVPDKS